MPAQPAAAGYRYHDLGGETPPFYLRRFRHADSCAAVSLVGPVELSGGADAERGAPAVALVQLTVGPRLLPLQRLIALLDEPDTPALLSRALAEAVFGLSLLERDDCPLCC